MALTPEIVVDARARLGEGPVWDDETRSLFWVDIESNRLRQYQPEGDAERSWDVGCKVGAAVPRKRGGMVLATANGFESFDLSSAQKSSLADPEQDLPENRFNDGKCDSRGRFWAGTMSMTRQPKAGKLYVLEPDHRVRVVLEDVTTSNGLGWSPDDGTMYYIDTPTMMVRAFDFDAATGSLANERTLITFPDGVGRPDGMTVDMEGMLWIAHWDGGRITRWDARTGQLLDTVRLPVDRVTSCAFGGPGLNVLFITTARHGLDSRQQAHQPHAGSLFAIEPPVGGLPANHFAG